MAVACLAFHEDILKFIQQATVGLHGRAAAAAAAAKAVG
jgi:hypothetical protein